MYHYDTLTEALNDLYKRGYTFDFNLRESSIQSGESKKEITPGSFTVVEMYRFEGISSAGDNSVLYAIETDTNLKGILVDAYGAYSSSVSQQLIAKLDFK